MPSLGTYSKNPHIVLFWTGPQIVSAMATNESPTTTTTKQGNIATSMNMSLSFLLLLILFAEHDDCTFCQDYCSECVSTIHCCID